MYHLKKVNHDLTVQNCLLEQQICGDANHVLYALQGFSVEGQENLQEILSKQLMLCQFLTALSIVRTGMFCLLIIFHLLAVWVTLQKDAVEVY